MRYDLHIMLPDEAWEAIHKLAKQFNRSPGYIARSLIIDKLNRLGHDIKHVKGRGRRNDWDEKIERHINERQAAALP